MANLTVRDIPEPLYNRLKERAAMNRRSLSAEVVRLLEEALEPRKVDEDPFILEAESFHARFAEPLPDYIAEGKRAGRKHE